VLGIKLFYYLEIERKKVRCAESKEILRVTACKYGESNDRSENSDLLLLRQKDPFGEVFSEIHFQSSSDFTFL